MAENFNLIFGSQAPETASWSDADYQTGWNTVGSTPPTAEQFDALQNRSDKKAQELNNRLSPLEQKAQEQGRQAGTAYAVGAAVTVDGLPADWLLVCTVAGTSGTNAITLPDTLIDGLTITDGAEGTAVTWTLRKIATNGSLGYRQPSTAYSTGNIAYHASLPTGWYLECTTAGTSGSGELSISTPTVGGTVSDGTVVWTVGTTNTALCDKLAFTGDLNDVYETGYGYYTNNATNKPGSLTGELIVVGNKNQANCVAQFALERLGSHLLWTRTYTEDSWSNWQQQEAIVAKSLNTNGYIKYASGLIIQWGKVSPTSDTTYELDVHLPISYTSSSTYAVFASLNTGNHNNIRQLGAYISSASKIGILSDLIWAGSATSAYWYTIGY